MTDTNIPTDLREMSQTELVTLLRNDTETWNRLYGEANAKGWVAHLYNTDLRDADLRDANLYEANLRDADLRDTDLRNANLYEANLCGTDLRGVDIRGAQTRGVKVDSLTAIADALGIVYAPKTRNVE